MYINKDKCLLSVLQIGLLNIYFKRYDTYHNTYVAIFDMYQWYILSGFRPKQLDVYKFHWNLGILITKIP